MAEFFNSYLSLPEVFYERVNATPVKDPKFAVFNRELGDTLGFSEKDLGLLSGNVPTKDSVALAYAGHQYGYFTMLGDGRALLIGEVKGKDEKLYDIQLKGSGRTRYSRAGDGRAALKAMLREYLISEAMHALGIPTTRSLAVIDTGEGVYRNGEEKGGILVRVAESHLRVGTFEFASEDESFLSDLAQYAINRHYPGSSVLEFLEKVIQKQAELVALWMGVGFIHGVMNTDNISISGETIDYGPCAFMNIYDPETVYSSIDTMGRYAFGRQPQIMMWNMARFAESLQPLIQNVDLLNQKVSSFRDYYNQALDKVMKDKLGGDLGDIQKLLSWMEKEKVDYTNFFSELTKSSESEPLKWWNSWNPVYEPRNPKVIPRNNLVEDALDAAVNDSDYQPFNNLLQVLRSPFLEPPQEYKVGTDSFGYRTFCGT